MDIWGEAGMCQEAIGKLHAWRLCMLNGVTRVTQSVMHGDLEISCVPGMLIWTLTILILDLDLTIMSLSP